MFQTISLGLFLLLLVVISHKAQSSQDYPANEVVLGTVEVSADSESHIARELVPSVQLYGMELTSKAAATLGETLEAELGVANSTFGPNVGLPLIRGQHGSRTRVMIGGVGTHDAAVVSPDHGVTIEPLLAESIRVVKGPAVIRHGGGAIGGAVEVEDRRIPDGLPEANGGTVQTRYNDNAHQRVGVLELFGGQGVLAWHLDAHGRRSGDIAIPGEAIDEAAIIQQFGLVNARNTRGSVDNTNAASQGGSVGASLVGSHGYLGFSLSRYDDDYGIPPGPAHSHGGGPVLPEAVRIDLTQKRVDLEGKLLLGQGWMKQVNLRYGDSRYKHVETLNSQDGTRFNNDAREGRLEFEHGFNERLTGTLGVMGLDRDFSAIGVEAFVPETAIGNKAWYLIETLDLAPWQIQIGVRQERVDYAPQPQKTVFGPTVPMAPRNFAPSSLSTALRRTHAGGEVVLNRWLAKRAPDVQELYALGPHLATRTFDVGASQLDMEVLDGWDLGLVQRAGRVDIRANIYRYRADNYIYQANAGLFWDTDEELFKVVCATLDLCLPVMRYEQQGARFQGHEVEIGWTFDSALLRKPRIALFSDRVRGRLRDGSDVPRLPPHRWGLAFEGGWHDWQGSLRVTRAEDQQRPGTNETPTKGYVRTDLELSRPLMLGPDLLGEFYFKIRNLTNSEIRNSTSFLRNYASEPGRAVELALRVDF